VKNHSDVGKNSESALKKLQIQKNRQSFFGKNCFFAAFLPTLPTGRQAAGRRTKWKTSKK